MKKFWNSVRAQMSGAWPFRSRNDLTMTQLIERFDVVEATPATPELKVRLLKK